MWRDADFASIRRHDDRSSALRRSAPLRPIRLPAVWPASNGIYMESFRFRFAALVMRHRGLTWLIFAVITAFFAVGIRNVQLKTIFSDLLPQDDPFVQVFKDHPNSSEERWVGKVGVGTVNFGWWPANT